MARTPYATDVYDTPQKSARIAGPIGYIVIHHAAALSYAAVIELEMGAREVSSTVIIKDQRCASMMDESWRAWSLGSALWDSLSLSVETCNDSLAPAYEISDASLATLAKVVADWCARYNIPCTRDRIIGHREVFTRYGASYATACPGGIPLDKLVAMAAEILGGTTPSNPTARKRDDMPYVTAKTVNGKPLYVLYDMYHWEESGDDKIGERWVDQFGPYQPMRDSVFNWRRSDPTQAVNKVPFPKTAPVGGVGGTVDLSAFVEELAELRKTVAAIKVTPTKATVTLS